MTLKLQQIKFIFYAWLSINRDTCSFSEGNKVLGVSSNIVFSLTLFNARGAKGVFLQLKASVGMLFIVFILSINPTKKKATINITYNMYSFILLTS